MKIKNKIGLTLIETMLAITLLGGASMTYLQLESKKAKNELEEDFEYELSKVLVGIDSKLMEDKLRDKKDWKDLTFKDSDFKDHLKHNLIHRESRCVKEKGTQHVDMKRSYIPCYFNLKTKIFDAKVSGDIEFTKKDKFKKYTLKFTPQGEDGIKKLNKLSKVVKRSLNDVLLYSDVSFVTKEVASYKQSSYLHCVKFKKDCFLLVTMGTRYNYLEDEKEEVVEVSYELHSIVDNKFPEIEKSESKEEAMSKISEYENVKDLLDGYGIDANKDEVRQFESTVNELKNDEEFVRGLEEQLDYKCSQYDEDDYYFMSLYEKDNVCYIYKTQGLHGEIN